MGPASSAALTAFSVGVGRGKDQNGESKGTYVGVVGRIQVRSYDDKEGPSTGGADKPPNSFDGMGETINDEEVPF